MSQRTSEGGSFGGTPANSHPDGTYEELQVTTEATDDNDVARKVDVLSEINSHDHTSGNAQPVGNVAANVIAPYNFNNTFQVDVGGGDVKLDVEALTTFNDSYTPVSDVSDALDASTEYSDLGGLDDQVESNRTDISDLDGNKSDQGHDHTGTDESAVGELAEDVVGSAQIKSGLQNPNDSLLAADYEPRTTINDNLDTADFSSLADVVAAAQENKNQRFTLGDLNSEINNDINTADLTNLDDVVTQVQSNKDNHVSFGDINGQIDSGGTWSNIGGLDDQVYTNAQDIASNDAGLTLLSNTKADDGDAQPPEEHGDGAHSQQYVKRNADPVVIGDDTDFIRTFHGTTLIGQDMGTDIRGSVVGIGDQCKPGYQSVTIGHEAKNERGLNVVIGWETKAASSCIDSIILGRDSVSRERDTVVIGTKSEIEDDNNSRFTQPGAVLIGSDAKIKDGVQGGVCIGHKAKLEPKTPNTSGFGSILIGGGIGFRTASVKGDSCVGVGPGVDVEGEDSTALGNFAVARGDEAAAIGAFADSNSDGLIKLGGFSTTVKAEEDLDAGGEKRFKIDHPSKPETHDLQHGAYEGPVPGGLLYSEKVECDSTEIDLVGVLPDYVTNGDFGRDWTDHVNEDKGFNTGYIDYDTWTLHVEEPGTYDLSLFGVRDDSAVRSEEEFEATTPKGRDEYGDYCGYTRKHPDFDVSEHSDIRLIQQVFDHREDQIDSDTPCSEAMVSYRVVWSRDFTIDGISVPQTELDGVNPESDLESVIRAAKAKAKMQAKENKEAMEDTGEPEPVVESDQ
jgi:hypothetical protein